VRNSVSFCFTIVLALGASAAWGHEVVYYTTLSGPAEFPTNSSPGTGWTRATFDMDLLTMRVEAEFSGLLGNTSASHIHCCTALPGTDPGVMNAIVATTTPSFTGFPLGVQSGTYDHTYDMSLASSYNAAFITANGGTVSLAFGALVAGLDANRAYMNIHSTSNIPGSNFPGGEIRGFLRLVPEPSALMLLLVGVIGLLNMRRKK
jgi:hypothetical protein